MLTIQERDGLDLLHCDDLLSDEERMARECARLAREIHGANGIVSEYPIMRHLVNMETVSTYEGTHDIHTLVLGQYVTGIPAFEPPPERARQIPGLGRER